MLSRKNVAAVVAEIIGTAVLTSVVLAVSRSPIGLPYFVALAAGLTLSLLVLIIGPASGAHVNPAVTLGMWTIRQINTVKAILYIAAQFLGATLALKLYEYLTDGPIKNIANKNFDWRVTVAEIVGTFIFTFGIAAAVYQKQELGRKAATIGGSLLLGILVASVASNGMLNPAVALGAQSWSKAYVFGPLVGAILGMNLYALLFADKQALLAGVGVKVQASSKTTKTSSRAKTAKKSAKAPAKKKPTTRKKR